MRSMTNFLTKKRQKE